MGGWADGWASGTQACGTGRPSAWHANDSATSWLTLTHYGIVIASGALRGQAGIPVLPRLLAYVTLS